MIIITGHVILTAKHRECMIAFGAAPDQVRDEVRPLSPQLRMMRIFEGEDVAARVAG